MAEEKTTVTKPSNPFVVIKLPADRSKKEGEVVWVNNKRYLIKRGVPVSVPESVALILEGRDLMLEYCAEYEAKVSN